MGIKQVQKMLPLVEDLLAQGPDFIFAVVVLPVQVLHHLFDVLKPEMKITCCVQINIRVVMFAVIKI